MIFKTRKILTVGIFLAVFAMGLLVSGGVVRAADTRISGGGFGSFTETVVNLGPWGWVAGVINNVAGTNYNPGAWISNNVTTPVTTYYGQFDINPNNYLDGSYNNLDTQADSVRQIGNSIQTQTAKIDKLETQLANGQNVMTEEAKAALQKEIDRQKGLLAQTQQAQKGSNTALGKAVDKNTASTGLLDLLGLAVSFVLYGIAYGLGTILMLVTKVMLMVAVFNNFINIAPVAIGWTITRDVCNNFFILLMIAMAIGTTLRVQNYQWRTMLPKVLLAAVLINFSKMLTGLLIDASQVIMLTFAAPLATLTGYNIILASFGLPSLAQLTSVTTQISTDASGAAVKPANLEWVDIFAALIFAIIVTIAALAVIIAIAGILCYRIIMLWFLVILSPLWIFGKAFSQLGSITSQWEGEIRKYLITGPVMMFFLYLAFMTMATFGANRGVNYLGLTDDAVKKDGKSTDIKATPSLTLKEGAGGQDSATNLSDMASPDGLINVMVVIGLLWGSLMMGRKFGGAGTELAGSAQGWIKKYTGANLAGSLGKTVSKGIQAAPGAIGTYADDKLGIRSKLYGAAYQVGGKFVPGLNAAIGGKIGSLEAGTAKREQAKIDAAGSAAGMNRMTQAQLRAKANSIGASTAQKMAATQALMKNGWMKDDDDVNGANNVKLLDFYRSQLPPELKNTFDNNLKKSNPNLALKSSMYSGGKDIAKLTEDIKDGKVKLADLMKDANADTLKFLRDANGGTNVGVMDYLIKNSKNDKEFASMMEGASRATKKAFSEGSDLVSKDNFISKETDPAALKKDQAKLDKMREAYIRSSEDFSFDRLFDATEQKKKEDTASAMQPLIASKASVEKLEEIMKDVGHVFDPHTLEQIQKRGSEFENKLKDVFNGIAARLNDTELTSTDDKIKGRAKKLMENALIAGSKVDNNTDGRRDVMKEILTGKNKSKVLDNLSEENITADFLRSGVKAGLSDTDYKKLNKQKVKDGFKDLTGMVDGVNANDDAKIYEQALINGAMVEHGSGATPAQQKAMKAALSGSKRADVLKNISHENIDDHFIKDNLGDLSAKEIRDLGRLSVNHKGALDRGLTAAYMDTNMGSAAMIGGIKSGQKGRAKEVMAQMAAAGTYFDLGGATGADTKQAFKEVAGTLGTDTLKNMNVKDASGVISGAHIESLAMNVPLKALNAFLTGTENRELAQAIVDKLREWKDISVTGTTAATDVAKHDRSNLFRGIL